VIERLKEKKGPVMIDELSFLSGIPLGTLSSVLLNLEFSGLVVSLPGKLYRLVNR